jgi:hypothetical protein
MSEQQKFIFIVENQVVAIFIAGEGAVMDKIRAVLSSDPKVIKMSDDFEFRETIQEGWTYTDGVFSPPA